MSPTATLSRRPAQIFSFPQTEATYVLGLADAEDREEIFRLRHEIYARELGQHAVNHAGALRDALDTVNIYLTARCGPEIAGFVSITPPRAPSFSVDKYFARSSLPFAFDDRLYEVRLLTVLQPHRGRELATLLMYAAYRWVEAHGGTRIVGIGRREVMDLYRRVGLEPVGLSTQSGAVTYDLVLGTITGLRQRTMEFSPLLARLEARTAWRLPFPFRQPASCFHGGAFFSAIGEQFDTLERRHDIINADVLDAWFPPAPGVTDTLQAHLPWLLRTSPPTDCAGLIETLAAARGVAPENILPGAGSSDLIFRVFRHWLTADSRVLILDPTYGEYSHVLEKVIGCTVDRLPLDRAKGYAVNLAKLEAALALDYDLVALVNPNSPTGRQVPREKLEAVLRTAPWHTRVWIDETYVEYAGPGQSLEKFAAASENVIVAKSMSKVYALSGARAAYLCAGPHQLEALRAITPPWVIGLPAQVAAVRALQDPAYYAARYRETAALRESLARELRTLGWDVLPGIANFLLCHLPVNSPDADTLVRLARAEGLFLRDAVRMGARLGPRSIRIAVKDAATNDRMLEVLRTLCPPGSRA
ncbi:histidinol-phosphate aminotransferase family protein [Opitutus sp. GAS368]|jgi:histidinol-phosphate/aromatic aminotransferase/cobyric acid decarboxylase-like protein|uniref:histidinol-phosphate aminotransferase family protein n=1 Tax=Opitutus sp. GAS368 TaxID=1882749 RepID=UPI00087DE96A|nr:histidinol-phosphate aminotransferase family protein [Opitutus sp. GAS368]SDR91507.1 Histidinol-phosphate/aromatic aminotransferase or cobyric acid decarboxylase [Opitutus sp. GAS368]